MTTQSIPTDHLPGWLQQLAIRTPDVEADTLSRFLPPADGSGRLAAVLMCFGETDGVPDVLLLERASTMRSHAGQIAFPGGACDVDDSDPTATALREANEEVGLRPESVQVFGEFPSLFLPPSRFVVTPILAWWAEPHPVSAVDLAEAAAVRRVPIAALADPANRCRVRAPSGYLGSGFRIDDWLIWGFTGGLLAQLLALGGWELPWDPEVIVDWPHV